MKRILELVLCGLLLFPVKAGAWTILDKEIADIPVDWSITVEPNGQAAVTMVAGKLEFYFDTTTGGAARGKSEVTTSVFSMDGDEVIISMDTKFSEAGDKVSRSIVLKDESLWNNVELMSISKGKLSVFGGEAERECLAETQHRITLAVSPNANMCAAWLDNEKVYSGEISNWKSGIDISNLFLMFKNSSSAKVQERADWTVENFSMTKKKGTYRFVSDPADGQEMVDIEGMKSINLNFGTTVGDSAFSKERYVLLCNDEEIPFTIEKTRNGVSLIPGTAIQVLSKYALKIDRVEDLYGEILDENIEVNFSTAYVGYKAPEVAWVGAEDFQIYAGETKPLLFTVSENVERIELLCDGQVIAATVTKPWIFSYSASESGTYELSLRAFERNGGSGKSETINAIVLKNDAPLLTISGISDGAEYSADNLPEIFVKAEDEQGVKYIKFYVDDVLIKTVNLGETGFSLEGIAGGERKITVSAADIYGAETVRQFQITIKAEKRKLIFETDFSDYSGNNSIPPSFQGGLNGGYLDVATMDVSHGKSAVIGIAEDLGNIEGSFLAIPAGSLVEEGSVEFELYMAEPPGGSATKDSFRIHLKRTGGTDYYAVRIGNDSVSFVDNDWSGGSVKSYAYTPKQWYKMQIKFCAKMHTVSVYITDEAGNRSILAENAALPDALEKVDHVRIFGPANYIRNSYIALDNVKCYVNYGLPEMQFDLVSDGDFTAKADVSSELAASAVNLDTVAVYDEYGKLTPESVYYNGSQLTINMKQPFTGGIKYRVVLSEDVKYSDGVTVGVASESAFTAAVGSVGVGETKFIKSTDGVKFKFKAQNKTGQDKNAVIISQVWEGKKIKKSSVCEVVLKANTGMTDYEISVPAILGREEVRTFIWNSLTKPAAMDIHTYTCN